MEHPDHGQVITFSGKVEDAAYLSRESYEELYQHSVKDPESFWGEQAQWLDWIKPWNKVKNTSYDGEVSIKWFEGATLNVCYNCVDRHLEDKADQPAIIWEGDDPNESRTLTYQELYEEVCRFANLLKTQGVGQGDRVTLYMPMVPEAAVAMLACARIGAVHSVVFGGFSPEALRGRIENCESDFVITADEGIRGGKKIPLKANVDKAIETLDHVKSVIILKRTGGDIDWQEGRDVWWHEGVADQPAECEPAEMDAEAPLFILYTSGSTGKPKGVMHTSGGYLLYAAMTHHYVFDYKPGEIYWCTADVGWVTGHSYIVYGPLANGATTLMFEGVPNYPDWSRFWQVVDKHQVNIFYTAPTAIRALMKQGDDFVKQGSRSSLRLLGSVGEPINPEAWLWYYETIGEKRCPIVDTWWQTETGGILMTPLVGTCDYKPGAAMQPFFGVQPVLLNQEGEVLEGEAEGMLCMRDSWPGQMRTVYGDHQRFKETYFSQFPGYYFSGDGCYRDKDGHYWITGRVDDVLNVSGHRLGTAEVESALVGHHGVAEAAVVGFPHDVKGQGIYAYVVLENGVEASELLIKELKQSVVQEIGAIARPDVVQLTSDLPKTRSGKIMRRILRKIAEGHSDFGDTSTLTNPEIVQELLEKQNIWRQGNAKIALFSAVFHARIARICGCAASEKNGS